MLVGGIHDEANDLYVTPQRLYPSSGSAVQPRSAQFVSLNFPRRYSIAVETNISPNIDADKKIIARHVSREYQIFVNALNQLSQRSLIKLMLHYERPVNGRRSEMDVNRSEAVTILQSCSLLQINIVALGIRCAEVSLKSNSIHNELFLSPPVLSRGSDLLSFPLAICRECSQNVAPILPLPHKQRRRPRTVVPG
jgi:hypothetical protein